MHALKFVSFVIAVALALSGCAALTTAQQTITLATSVSVPDQTVAATITTFNAIEQLAADYDRLPPCVASAPTLCRTPAGVNAIAPAIRTGRIARNQLRKQLTAGATSVPVVSYNTLASAIITLQGIYAQYKIKAQQ